jgi:alkyl sulfatase BDS1-like metallo-beta-lactamase superfamily hydrolase
MAVFLSDEWFAAVDGTRTGCDPDVTFRLDQVVTGAPGGDLRYRVSVTGGTLHVSPGPTPDRSADATLTVPYATAVELASGRRTAHDAFLAGAVRFAGDPRRLQELAAALGSLGDALAAVRDATTYPQAG